MSEKSHLQPLSTDHTWEDLVLDAKTRKQVEDIVTWTRHSAPLGGRMGYRCLFTGPPAQAKALTAALIGKASGRPVYRVDLAVVVFKHASDTEQALARVFDEAARKGAILFFDEADALFGKRGEVKDSHDRYANQEISFLLQRIEKFPGVVIVASNIAAHIDEAFARRFQSVIIFTGAS